MTSDQERLNGYIQTWKSAVDDVVTLLRDLDQAAWSIPSDLPGWDVRSIAAHLAHLESELSGAENEPVALPELEHASALTALYTEAGVRARDAMGGQEIVDELASSAAARLRSLQENPPTDASAIPETTPGGVRWTWETLLSNRVVDVWMHEQDIRRAVGRPGGMSGPAAAHTVAVFTMALPYAVGKKVAPPVGTSVVVDVTGVHPVHLAVEIADNGRAVPMAADPDEPTVALRLDTETFVVLAGGRRSPDEVPVQATGDQDLGRRVLEAMAVTP